MIDVEYFFKCDIKIESNLNENDILKMLKHISTSFTWRLETDDLDCIWRLLGCNGLFDKLEELGITFLFNGTEIKPKKINNEEDKRNFVDEVRSKVKISME